MLNALFTAVVFSYCYLVCSHVITLFLISFCEIFQFFHFMNNCIITMNNNKEKQPAGVSQRKSKVFSLNQCDLTNYKTYFKRCFL